MVSSEDEDEFDVETEAEIGRAGELTIACVVGLVGDYDSIMLRGIVAKESSNIGTVEGGRGRVRRR